MTSMSALKYRARSDSWQAWEALPSVKASYCLGINLRNVGKNSMNRRDSPTIWSTDTLLEAKRGRKGSGMDTHWPKERDDAIRYPMGSE